MGKQRENKQKGKKFNFLLGTTRNEERGTRNEERGTRNEERGTAA